MFTCRYLEMFQCSAAVTSYSTVGDDDLDSCTLISHNHVLYNGDLPYVIGGRNALISSLNSLSDDGKIIVFQLQMTTAGEMSQRWNQVRILGRPDQTGRDGF